MTQFYPGDRVRWKDDGYGITGELGTVLRVEPGYLCVKFDNQGRHTALNPNAWDIHHFENITIRSPFEHELDKYIRKERADG